jgi:hypothetical protein
MACGFVHFTLAGFPIWPGPNIPQPARRATGPERRPVARLHGPNAPGRQPAGAQNPTALPGDFSIAEFAKDGALHDAFEALALLLAQLNDDVQGTLMALNSELFLQFLDVYACAKANNRDGRYNTFINAVKERLAKTPSRRPQPRRPRRRRKSLAGYGLDRQQRRSGNGCPSAKPLNQSHLHRRPPRKPAKRPISGPVHLPNPADDLPGVMDAVRKVIDPVLKIAPRRSRIVRDIELASSGAAPSRAGRPVLCTEEDSLLSPHGLRP